MFKIELGSTVKHRVSGYKGIVTGRHEYLYGCRSYTVQAQELKDGKPVDHIFADEDACEVLKMAKPHKVRDTGGPMPEPPRRTNPAR